MNRSKIKFYLKESYHRPLAKLESLKMVILRNFYSKQTDVFSERSSLLKKPMGRLIFYNFYGRCILYIRLFISIIIFNKFPESSDLFLSSVDKKRKKNNKINEKYTIRPFLPFHYYEKNNFELNDYDSIIKYYFLHLEAYQNQQNDSAWWMKCRDEFQANFLIEKKSINIDSLNNFRSNNSFSAALLSDASRLLNRRKHERLRKIDSLRLVMHFHELAERIDTNVLLINSESSVGNPPRLWYRGIYLTQRILRYSFYVSSMMQALPFLLEDEKSIVVDIGGGYGGLIRSLKYIFNQHTYILCELPETLLLAHYYLKSCFPSSKILHVTDKSQIKNLSKDCRNYQFVFITPDLFYGLDQQFIDLTINTTSLGEMIGTAQQNYINTIERTSKYFYSVNRYGSSLLYATSGFNALEFKSRWIPLKTSFTHTYHFEFIGKNLGII